MPPDTRSGQSISEIVISFLKDDEFKKIISCIVQCETNKLYEEITSLKNEVTILRESNIQLLHLTSNYPRCNTVQSYSSILQTDSGNNKSTNIIKSSEMQSQTESKKTKKSNDKKNVLNKNNATSFSQRTEKNGNAPVINNEESTKTSGSKGMGNSEWESQRKRKQRFSRSIVYGNLTGGTMFKGVTKYTDYHVFNCDREMRVEELSKYLTEEIKIPNIICEKMDSKHPDRYSSFKISVPVNHVEAFKDPNIWPEYVCINRFENRFFRKKSLTISDERERREPSL